MSPKSITTTVVIPCFNDGAYICDTIDSVLAQTCREVEIIVVDDASTDMRTKEVLKKLDIPNVRVIYLENNSGPSVARNRGITEARGKYILPVDADDKIAPTYIEKAQKVLEDDPDIGIVYCDAELFGKKSGKWELPPYAFPDILVGNMIFATALYRKSDWERVGGYNENMRQGNEDYDFWLSLIELGVGVYKIPETLFYYRIKKNSRTLQLRRERANEIATYEQIFRNHQSLYLDHIAVFFEALKEADEQQRHKDNEIRMLHSRLHRKELELKRFHKYASSVAALKDAQLSLKNEQIDFLQSLTIKRRLKYKLKRFIPNALLKLFGFSPYEAPAMPERDLSNFSEETNACQYRYQAPEFDSVQKDQMEAFLHRPLISIIMPVYNVDPKWLKKAIDSVEAQWYESWELCIADDCSTNEATRAYLKSLDHPKIKIAFLEKNLNISGASNAALEMTEGEYIALLDNDDELTPDALYEMVKVINRTDADFIYSDEDFIDTEGNCSNPHFKPDFSPDLLLSHNYITHFTCFRRRLLEKTGYFDSRFDGSQDYDLFLRLTEQTESIEHIPKVLYHWRMIEGSTSANSEAKPEAIERGRKVLESAMQRRGIKATIEHGNLNHFFRVRYEIIGTPLISIIIPFKDKPELLEMCIGSILEKSTYRHYEIIGISNNSEEKETFEMMEKLRQRDSRVSFFEYNTPFNYADINNHAVEKYAKGEHLLLLNNDIEVIDPEWMEAMLEHSQREEIGCVGAKLYYPDDTIQHAGVIIGLGGYAGHAHKMYPRDNPGYFNRLNAIQNVSAVTAACMMVKREIYDEVGGMDADRFKVAYNDVDFCLRVREAGYLNLFTPYAQMYHHESISRGYETTPEKLERFQREKDALLQRHWEILENGDPYYNPNLTQDKEDFSLCPK